MIVVKVMMMILMMHINQHHLQATHSTSLVSLSLSIYLYLFSDRSEGRVRWTVRRLHPHLVAIRPHHYLAADYLRTTQAYIWSGGEYGIDSYIDGGVDSCMDGYLL